MPETIMNLKALEGALKKASKSPKIDEGNEEIASKLYQQQLKKIIKVIYAAQQSSNEGMIDAAQFAHLLFVADSQITRLCKEQYDNEITDEVSSFDADAVDSAEVIKTKKYLLSTGAGQNSPLRDLLMYMAQHSKRSSTEIEAKMKSLEPPPWTETPRPNHEHSTLLSRFSDKYDSEAVGNVIEATPGTKHGPLRALLEARAELRTYETCNPVTLALGNEYLALACAGGYKEREGVFVRFAIPPVENDGEEHRRVDHLISQKFNLGFSEPAKGLLYHSENLWAYGDSRIKGYDAKSNQLKYTLDSSEIRGKGAFSITEDTVFQLGRDGRIHSWNIKELTEHQPAMFNGSRSIEPLGGRISSDDWWLDDDGQADVEMSCGQKPSSSTTISRLNGLIDIIAPIPNSTKYLCSSSGLPEEDSTYAVKIFDIAHITTGASVAGIGMAAGVEDFATHLDLPNLYVTAGGDQLARVFDIRNPIAQIFLDGHSQDIDCCTIGSQHSNIPLIFTAGKDEVVKAWDIRQSKQCLYELSTGTLRAVGLAYHDERNTLFVACTNNNADRLGYHHDYYRLGRGNDSEEDDEEEQEDSENATHWPKQAKTGPDYFARRWCKVEHSVLEYRFRVGAEKDFFPPSETPSSMRW